MDGISVLAIFCFHCSTHTKNVDSLKILTLNLAMLHFSGGQYVYLCSYLSVLCNIAAVKYCCTFLIYRFPLVQPAFYFHSLLPDHSCCSTSLSLFFFLFFFTKTKVLILEFESYHRFFFSCFFSGLVCLWKSTVWNVTTASSAVCSTLITLQAYSLSI